MTKQDMKEKCKCHKQLNQYTMAINPDTCEHLGKPYWDRMEKITKVIKPTESEEGER